MADKQLFTLLNNHFAKAADILDIGTTFQTAVDMVTLSLPAGTYLVGYSFECNFNGKKDAPMWFRMTGTFGSADEFAISAGTQDGNKKNRFYMFPKEHVGGAITIGLDVKKDGAIPTMDVTFADVLVMRIS